MDRFDLNIFYDNWPPAQGDERSDLVVRCYRQRHNSRWNVLFCDDHVEALRLRKLFDSSRDAVLQRWNRDNQPHRDTAVLPVGIELMP